MSELVIRPPRAEERAALATRLVERWGTTVIISRDREHDAAGLPALVAARGATLAGLATYALEDGDCELVTLDAYEQRQGVGSALLAALGALAAGEGCGRLWLGTTNDNLDALRFYQRRGMRLAAVHRGAVDRARELKPSIPAEGLYGIPIHDELELELRPPA